MLEDRTREAFGVEQLHSPILDQASPGTPVKGLARESLEHDARDPGPPQDERQRQPGRAGADHAHLGSVHPNAGQLTRSYPTFAHVELPLQRHKQPDPESSFA